MIWYIWLILSLCVIALGVMTYFIIKWRKEDKLDNQKEYEQVLADFNKAELLYSQQLKGGVNDKQINPYAILWEIAKSKRGIFNEGERTAQTRVSVPELPSIPIRRQTIPGHINAPASGNQPKPIEHQGGNRNRLFGRRIKR